MSLVYDWKHWNVGSFEGFTAQCNAAMQALAAEVWLDHGEWNWTIYYGSTEWPGGAVRTAEEAMTAVQERLSRIAA
jgi:hypothetical protein